MKKAVYAFGTDNRIRQNFDISGRGWSSEAVRVTLG